MQLEHCVKSGLRLWNALHFKHTDWPALGWYLPGHARKQVPQSKNWGAVESTAGWIINRYSTTHVSLPREPQEWHVAWPEELL